MAKKPDLKIFKKVEEIPDKNQETYRCVCGDEFKALWRYQLHLQQCKIAKLVKQLKKKEPEKLKELAMTILEEMGEETPSEKPEGEKKDVSHKTDVASISQPEPSGPELLESIPAETDDLLKKIQELYRDVGPGGIFYDIVNRRIYDEAKPARVLQQVANNLMAQTREILQELLDRAKYRKELF